MTRCEHAITAGPPFRRTGRSDSFHLVRRLAAAGPGAASPWQARGFGLAATGGRFSFAASFGRATIRQARRKCFAQRELRFCAARRFRRPSGPAGAPQSPLSASAATVCFFPGRFMRFRSQVVMRQWVRFILWGLRTPPLPRAGGLGARGFKCPAGFFGDFGRSSTGAGKNLLLPGFCVSCRSSSLHKKTGPPPGGSPSGGPILIPDSTAQALPVPGRLTTPSSLAKPEPDCKPNS